MIHSFFLSNSSFSSVFFIVSPPGQNLRSVKTTSNSPLHTLTQIYIYQYIHSNIYQTIHSFIYTPYQSFIYITHQSFIHTPGTHSFIHTHRYILIHTLSPTYPTPTCTGFGYTPQRLRSLSGPNASSGYNLRPYQLCCIYLHCILIIYWLLTDYILIIYRLFIYFTTPTYMRFGYTP